ncbi:MAG TPA: hypothetical protein VHG35_10265, partial [Gemmatimonadales bacterium]|nr:hypothetical protein [Gemmatimonadales bacterium]
MKAVPSRVWLWGAAVLALIAPAGLWWPGALTLLLVLDIVWVVAFLVDAVAAPGAGALHVRREAPVAFSLGRQFVIRYVWRHDRRRRLLLRIKE